MKKKFSYPFNGDINNLENILIEFKDYIKEIYFPLPTNNKLHTPRQTKYKFNFNKKNLIKIYNITQKHKININLLINSSIRDKKFYKERGVKKIFKDIQFATKLGINTFTIGDLPLAKEIKKHFPQINISISATAQIDNISKLEIRDKYVKPQEVCLDTSVNKNLNLIKDIKKNFPNIKIKIIINENCIYNCPMRYQHRNIISCNITPEPKYNYTSICIQEKTKNPRYIYKSGMLTPFILNKYYTDLIDIFKLVGRSNSTEYNINQIRHYLSNEKYYLLKNNQKVFEPEEVFLKLQKCDKNCINCNFCKKIYLENNQ